jgi:hypothetical protein
MGRAWATEKAKLAARNEKKCIVKSSTVSKVAIRASMTLEKNGKKGSKII